MQLGQRRFGLVNRGTRLGMVVAMATLVGCTGSQPSPRPTATAVTSSPSVTPEPIACAQSAVPDPLGVEQLSQPLARDGDKLAVQILIAPDSGETDLGKEPDLMAFRLAGPAPIVDSGERAIAFEASQGPDCVIRIVVDTDLLKGGKGSPRLVEWDLGSTTHARLPADDSGLCTWIITNEPKSAGIECAPWEVTGTLSIPRARAWIRVAWATPQEGSLPEWATAP